MSEAESQEIDLYDGNDRHSLLHKLHLWKELVAAIKDLPPHLIGASERELRQGFKPNAMLERIKISFWDEYRRAQRAGSLMVLGNVVNGLCTKEYFFRKIRDDRLSLAWLITPPPEELLVQKHLLQLGMKRIEEILGLPIHDIVEKVEKGTGGKKDQVKRTKKVNVALIKEIRSIVELLANRVHGAVIQRQQIEAKTLSVNVDGGSTAAPGEISLGDIERDLKRLEKMASKAKGLLPEAQEVEAETIDGEVEPSE